MGEKSKHRHACYAHCHKILFFFSATLSNYTQAKVCNEVSAAPPTHPPHLPGHIGVDGAGGALEEYLQPLLQVLGRWAVLDAQIEQLHT